MSQRGKPSTAHHYDKTGACIYCGMYKANVDLMSHECTPVREALADNQVVLEADLTALQQQEALMNDHGE